MVIELYRLKVCIIIFQYFLKLCSSLQLSPLNALSESLIMIHKALFSNSCIPELLKNFFNSWCGVTQWFRLHSNRQLAENRHVMCVVEKAGFEVRTQNLGHRSGACYQLRYRPGNMSFLDAISLWLQRWVRLSLKKQNRCCYHSQQWNSLSDRESTREASSERICSWRSK